MKMNAVNAVKHVPGGDVEVMSIDTAGSTVFSRAVLTHCGRVRQICVFNTAKLGTSASSP